MASTPQIRVLVVHDDPLMQAGLVAALGSYAEFELVTPIDGTVEGALELLEGEPHWVDVLIADYASGIDIAEHFGAGSGPRIMIVTASDSEWDIRSATQRGITGYVLAGSPLDQLAAGIRTLHRGASYFSPVVTQRLADSLSAAPLTRREQIVLGLVVDGLCNKAIANRLGVALVTVKTHLTAVFEKLGVNTRTQAVIAVARRGLLRQRVHEVARNAHVTRFAEARRQEAGSC